MGREDPEFDEGALRRACRTGASRLERIDTRGHPVGRDVARSTRAGRVRVGVRTEVRVRMWVRVRVWARVEAMGEAEVEG